MELCIPQKEDLHPWLQMRRRLWPYQPRAVLWGEQRDICRRMAAGERMTFLAKEDGACCGFIELSLRDSAPGCGGGPIGFIEGWYVAADRRGQGVGGLLVRAGEDWARGRGCREMASHTARQYPASPPAHAALGYDTVWREYDEYFFRKEL